MNVKWLIENFEADNKIHKLIAEIKSRNQPLEIIDYYNYYLRGQIKSDDGTVTTSSFADDDCVIFQGSIQLALWIKQNKPWVPGIWLDPHKFKCSTYYSYLGQFLFNQDYEFTTVGEYKRNFEQYYKYFSVDNCIFIRPDTGLKSFTGQIFKRERHDTDWKYFDQTTKPEDLIIISSPKTIKAEYRLVVAKGNIVASSQYQREGKREQLPGCPVAVARMGMAISSVIDSDLKVGPMYVVDIAVTHDDIPRLMEINCFNCSGMYEADKKAIIDAANQLAWEEYVEYKKVE